MGDLLGSLFVFAAGMLIFFIVIYIFIAILLNKLNKLIYGKGTPMAWIPLANIYLLGKLTVNKLVGWLLIICFFLTGTVTTTVNGVEKTTSILPEKISNLVSSILGIIIILLFIYAIVKYIKLKKKNSEFVNDQNNVIYNQQEIIQSVNIQNTEPQSFVEESVQPVVDEMLVNNPINNSTVQVEPIDIPFDEKNI